MTTLDTSNTQRSTQAERSRAVHWSDPSLGLSAAEGLSGLDYLQVIVAGKIAPSPIGFAFAAVDKGRAEFTLEPASASTTTTRSDQCTAVCRSDRRICTTGTAGLRQSYLSTGETS
jgi:hypothetical protein